MNEHNPELGLEEFQDKRFKAFEAGIKLALGLEKSADASVIDSDPELQSIFQQAIDIGHKIMQQYPDPQERGYQAGRAAARYLKETQKRD